MVTLLLPALGLAAAPAASARTTAAPGPATTRTSVHHAAGAAARPPAAPAADSRLQISLSSVSPTIAGPGQTVTVRGTVSNRGTSAVPRPVAHVVLGEQPLPTREAVDSWAAAQGPAQGREVGRTPLGSSLPAGGTANFVVNIKNAAGLGQATYGALPLSVEVAGSSLRTFAGYQRQKQYQPLRLGWVVPLTLDADPELFGPEGPARDVAWEKALGAGSRLGRVVESTESAPVTWALDPTLVPSLLPPDTGEPLSAGPDTETDEAALRSAVEERIRGAAAQHSPWVLPDTDADVAAVADAEAPSGLMAELIGRSSGVARALDGRADVAWPADGRYTAAREDALRRLFSSQPRLGAQLAAQSTLPLGGNTQDAHRRSADGLPVLGYDDELSALFAQTSSPAGASLGLQHFIADTVALLDERPGTSGRSVLVAAPRSFDPDPTAAAGFLEAVNGIPWLEPVSTSTLLADAKRAVPMPKQVGTRPTPQGTPTASADPYATKRPPLTPRRLRDLEESEQTVRGVGLIRDDGDAFTRTWGRAAEQLASSRWRAFPTGWTKLHAEITAATRETTSSIEVSRRNINFLAETGRLQITVTNDLDVAVENVKLTLEPANPRLRIDSQPPVMRIGANSRATAVVSVTTLAAGPVPIRTTLTTPDGTVIGQGADVLVQVTPTGDWVYWTLGGFAGIILLLGIWRSVRRKPEPVNAAEPLPTSQGTA